MTFREWLADQVDDGTVLGWTVYITIFPLCLDTFIAVFISIIKWPFVVPVYTAILFGYAYYKYKKDTKK